MTQYLRVEAQRYEKKGEKNKEKKKKKTLAGKKLRVLRQTFKVFRIFADKLL